MLAVFRGDLGVRSEFKAFCFQWIHSVGVTQTYLEKDNEQGTPDEPKPSKFAKISQNN